MNKIQMLRKQTYQEAVELLNTYGKCAIIRPTGFGKTGILTKFIKSGRYKKILYLYPAEVIKDTVLNFYYSGKTRKDTIPNVVFMTYMALTNLSETTIESLKGIDLIICDECHRLGATETMEGMQELIAASPSVHLLGATATPERMDMIDEIAMFFDDRVTSRYSLHDAFQDKVLQKPYYCFCAFGESDPENLAKIEKEAMLQVDNTEDRKYMTDLLKSRMIEIAKLSQMDNVIKSTLEETAIDTDYQKYIVFFSDFSHMRKAKRNVKKWFKAAFPQHKINEVIISSEKEEYRKNVSTLGDMTYRPATIDLIYTCEMLNMGYHVSDLTGILMYRGTTSSIIYMQQLGRALSTGDAEPKIVFDIVDNIHRKSLYTMLSEDMRSNQNVTEAELQEYKELVQRTHDKDENGYPIPLTAKESARLIELSKLIKKITDIESGKVGNNTLYPTDLVVTKYAATYKELIAKTVAEPISMRCRQAWTRWVEKGGDASILTREYILNQQAPTAVPLPPFCKLKNVSVNAVLAEMGIA